MMNNLSILIITCIASGVSVIAAVFAISMMYKLLDKESTYLIKDSIRSAMSSTDINDIVKNKVLLALKDEAWIDMQRHAGEYIDGNFNTIIDDLVKSYIRDNWNEYMSCESLQRLILEINRYQIHRGAGNE